MAIWDVFHSDRLELERALETGRVIEALARGDLTVDDLIRPSGTSTPWTRIGDRPALLEAATTTAPSPEPQPPPTAPREGGLVDFDDLDDEEEVGFPSESEIQASRGPGQFDLAEPAGRARSAPPPTDEPYGEYDLDLRNRAERHQAELSSVEVAALHEDDGASDDLEEYDPLEEDEAIAEFTLSRGRPETVEELDLAAMVDVAFQLVLFFLVTATTVLYKTLEVPSPNPDANPPAAAAQGQSRSLDDLRDDFILVEVDPEGAIKVDREPVAANREAVVARLREARRRTNRQGLLLSADFATPHRNAVLVYDAANEARLNIAIARPRRVDAP
ncbi:MAG: ExbD/TolR family protein [Isosphaeraceae bacterium]